MKVGRKQASPSSDGRADVRATGRVAGARPRRATDTADRAGRPRAERPRADRPRADRARTGTRRPHEPRGLRQRPQTAPSARPAERPARPKTTTQAKARAKARKAKAPKVVRPPLRERLHEKLIARLEGVDLRPQALLARVPFVVLVIAALAVGLAVTLWLSTDAAQRSYQLGSAKALNNALTEQKEALERDVLQAESAPALADAARNLGMIPSRDTAHLVQDPAGNWVVVGKPKPAEGAPPPSLNTKLPDEKPPAPPAPPAPAPKPGSSPELPKRVGPMPLAGLPATGASAGLSATGASAGLPATVPGSEVPVVLPPVPGTPHGPAGSAPAGPALPGPALPGPTAAAPADTLAVAPPAPAAVVAPTVVPVPDVAVVVPVAPVAPVIAGVPPQ